MDHPRSRTIRYEKNKNLFMLHIPGLFVASSEEKGRGVFTARELTKGDIIEFCPLILIPKQEQDYIHQSILHDYYFLSPAPSSRMCIVLGYGSLYNHSFVPNADIVFDLLNKQLEIHCVSEIEAGEEIFIDYTGGIKDAPKLWFEPK